MNEDRLSSHNHGDCELREEIEKEVERLRGVLEEISEGKGRFSRDHFEHCRNTVEDMKALAIEALAPKEESGERSRSLHGD